MRKLNFAVLAAMCLSHCAVADEAWSRSSADALVARWCDALMARQISGCNDRMIDGGIACPACGVLHGRICDLVYPFVYLWADTGDGKYLTAAEKAIDWTEATMRREDGGVYNDYQCLWWGTAAFAQIALGKTLLYYGDRLPAPLRERWLAIFRRETDFLVSNFYNKLKVGINVNYPAAFCEAMALAGRVLDDPDKTARAKEMAGRVMAQFMPDGLLSGEGTAMELRSPRGLAYVDLGYNLEETLPSLMAYAELCNDRRMKDAVLSSAAAHAEFLLPDGGLDNSFGSRSYKWTYYGSRTSDGMLPILAALAKAGTPWAVRAMRLQLELYERCTLSSGLLAGGMQYEAAGEPACVHQAFTHVKSLVDVLRDTSIPRSGPAEPLPREREYGLKSFPSIGASLASVGPWRVTFAAGDAFIWNKTELRVTGGGPSLAWHEAAGPVLVGTMADYHIVEARNMQDLRHERSVLSMTPRIESAEGFSSAREANAEVSTSYESNVVVCTAHGRLTGHGDEKGAAYTLKSKVEGGAFSLEGSCAADARFILPIVALDTDRVDVRNGRIRIERGGSVVTVESSLPFALEKTDSGERAFSPIAGFSYAYLTAPVRAGVGFSVRISAGALAQSAVGWDSSVPAKMPESKHVFSMSCKVTSVNGDLATKEGRAKAVAWWKGHRITKLWLESYRHGQGVSSELLAEERDAFRAEGFEVCGMITPTSLSTPTPKQRSAKFWITCWSDPMARERIKEECARAARLFDTVILDDFMFSSCNDKCARCSADKAARKIGDWGEYRRTLLYEVCERDVLPAVKAANPKSHFIIKYPCWYKHYGNNGYSPVRQAKLFGECWIGTETRDANPEPLQACWIAAWMDSITGGLCGGGWYDPLDCGAEKFVEQARYTILGGMKESLVHCYDYLLAEDPGVMYESSARSHDCCRAFEREIESLAALAESVRGAERGKFEMLPCGVSRHEFRKDGKAFTIYLNTKGETVQVPGTDIVLGPHEMRTVSGGA